MSIRGSPQATSTRRPVALIAGPTASGKSDLAVRLARRLAEAGRPAAIVNADSAQVYADLRIVSARPGEDETGGIEHCLFGAWDGALACSAADWAGAARGEIDRLHAAGAVPILVGGTGLYIRTLLDGIAAVPPIDPAMRAAVRALPPDEARAALAAEDPDRAAALAPGDRQRIARALEVVRSTGRTLKQWQDRAEGGIGDRIDLVPLVMLPDRDWLNQRCDRRFAAMLEEGAEAEVARLLRRRLDPELPVMRAIGVPEIAALLAGEATRDEALAAGRLATRRYAKRQFTWFRNQTPREWQRAANFEQALDMIHERLLP